jgi:hypothetical protein
MKEERKLDNAAKSNLLEQKHQKDLQELKEYYENVIKERVNQAEQVLKLYV